MHMIIGEAHPFRQRFSHRILYAGNDLALLKYLQDTIEDCQTVRCPDGSQARLFIDKIKYSLLVFDEVLPDCTGAELTRFVRSLAHREKTPIIIFRRRDNLELLARTIARLLICPKSL